ncbi:MAG: IPT/TIG domain-containing protein [Pseudomonadota bacterium]
MTASGSAWIYNVTGFSNGNSVNYYFVYTKNGIQQPVTATFNHVFGGVSTAPSISSLSPVSGMASSSVTLSGANFGATQGTGSVKFGTTTATITSWSATAITATVPALAAGASNVTVTTSAGTSNAAVFTVTSPVLPSITSLNPTSGLAGSSVTISGANLGSTGTVKFGTTNATWSVWSANSITVTVPALAAGASNVTVTNTVGTSNAVAFTVTTTNNAPVITAQPLSQTIAVGQIAHFAVSVTGTAPFSYQWRKNGSAINGATSASYATPAAVSADNGANFSVVVTNVAGNVTSANATLTIGVDVPPDFGPNMTIFDASWSAADIQAKLNAAYALQQTNQFGTTRYAFAFKPGSYTTDANIGFYTHVLGLGLSPDDVKIAGNVRVEANWEGNGPNFNATQNFWRAAENMAVTPPGVMHWSVAQAVPFRRMHVLGSMWTGAPGWASGGYIADSKIDNVYSGSQQQWFTRNSQLLSAPESVWNMVFLGVTGTPPTTFPNPPITNIAQTPVVREKPFLYVDASNKYQVFVPALRSNSQGASWTSGTTAGTSLPINQFYIVRSDNSSAAAINTALAQGKNLLFTPGIYHITDTIRITRADTVVLGLGFATIIPDNGVIAMSVADVDGVKIAGILFDAGTVSSPVLLEVGPTGSNANHAANPTSLTDIFMRVGGTGALGKAAVGMKINSNNVIGDHFWLWRADHGQNVAWNMNTSDTGLIVNGANVTLYGLFVEHFQKEQVIWNGNGGRTYFFQNEIPYDVPNQASWMNGSSNGYAAYKVANSVTTHEGWGLGSYCFFETNPSVNLSHSFEAPTTAGIKFHNLTTVSLGGIGSISHIINDIGAMASAPLANNRQTLTNYP